MTDSSFRPERTYRPSRWRHIESIVMSALTRAGLVPHSSLLTTAATDVVEGTPR